jgi:hypothetical protein
MLEVYLRSPLFLNGLVINSAQGQFIRYGFASSSSPSHDVKPTSNLFRPQDLSQLEGLAGFPLLCA